VCKIMEVIKNLDSKKELLREITRIHNLGWIPSKRLDKFRNEISCKSPNCGGYTLEAELGIIPNGYSEPDFLGWEVKQFHVANFKRYNSSVITLMTPEPTSGFYVNNGTEEFIRKYGYSDTKGRDDRLNFGGIHKVGTKNEKTKLKLVLVGFDYSTGKIKSADGRISLIDEKDNEAASWDYTSLLKHWNRKHNQACYVPSLSENLPLKKYYFGNRLMLGMKTDFQLFLKEMSVGNVYYDPGIKLENASSKSKIKKRSQFRIVSRNISNLYFENEIVFV